MATVAGMSTTIGGIEVHGTVAEGFGKVADAFAGNFTDPGELGAGFALYVGGECKVDIWAGVADEASRRVWDENTLQLVFSTTKGATAICIAKLVEAGLLDYAAPVVQYWPEFGAHGKDTVTVEQLMSHQAGLPYVDGPLTLDEVLAVTPVVEALAAEAPKWEPGTAHGYHAVTYGWLAGELVRRVDGRSIGMYFAEEVAAPLGLEFWIGLPASEEIRVSTLKAPPAPTDPAVAAMVEQFMGEGTPGWKALTMSGAFGEINDNDDSPFNTREVHATEMPAANGITNAGSLARMYAATVGDVDGVRLLSADMVERARAERVNAPDMSLVLPTRFGAGFMLDTPFAPLLTPESFGHPGAGGSLGYADPTNEVGYGYVMNEMHSGLTGDPRTVNLNNAVRDCLS